MVEPSLFTLAQVKYLPSRMSSVPSIELSLGLLGGLGLEETCNPMKVVITTAKTSVFMLEGVDSDWQLGTARSLYILQRRSVLSFQFERL